MPVDVAQLFQVGKLGKMRRNVGGNNGFGSCILAIGPAAAEWMRRHLHLRSLPSSHDTFRVVVSSL